MKKGNLRNRYLDDVAWSGLIHWLACEQLDISVSE